MFIIKKNIPSEIIYSIKIAKLHAMTNLSKFINGSKVQIIERLISFSETTQESEVYYEYIREKSVGTLRNIIDLGGWKINNRYYHAFGIFIKSIKN